MNRLILFLIGIVLVGIAGFMAIWFGTGRELQAPSVAFLMNCKDRKFQAVYDSAHPAFRESRSVDQLEDLWEHWEKKHGVFGEVLRRLGVHKAPAGSAWEQMLSLELGFFKGHILGRFYFKIDAEIPKLVHVWLATKPTVEMDPADRSSLEPSARALFSHLGASDFAALYDGFDPELQMRLTPKRLHDQMEALIATAGPLGEVTLTSKTAQGDLRVVQLWKLAFDKQPFNFEVTHEHSRGQWSVVEFLPR
jgi:hypothetical protein